MHSKSKQDRPTDMAEETGSSQKDPQEGNVELHRHDTER